MIYFLKRSVTMKKLSLLIGLLLLSILLIVSCGKTAVETTSTKPSSETTAPVAETTAEGEITTKPLITSIGFFTTAKPSETTEAPATSTAPVTTTPIVTEATTATVTSKVPALETEPKVTTVAVPITTVPETTSAPITYTAKSWMGAIPDATPLNNIAIPGTHDSGATKDMILSGTAKCQTLSIADQLNAGVRFFDIRLRRVNGSLHVYHGQVDQKLTFDEVLTACYTFLADNPTEVLMMSIKEEYDASGTNGAFHTMVANKIGENANYWHTSGAIPQIGTVRGKIVLVRRYSGTSNFGINASSGWTDNATFSTSAGTCLLSVQDYYNNDSADAKWNAITAMFQKMKYQKSTYYLNFTSGYKGSSLGIPNINTIKNAINPKLIEYLKTSPDFVGIVIVDFVTDEIANLIYEVNFD